MTRLCLALPLLLAFTQIASAQDMPLSQILIDGEGWQRAEGNAEQTPGANQVSAASPDGGTVFTWEPGELFVHAAPAPLGTRSPYAPLRVPAGKASEVTSILTDKDGRIYAATPVGVQVFDPTGRLCGVLHSPAAGTITGLAFKRDQLVAWVGGARYTRKLKTTAP